QIYDQYGHEGLSSAGVWREGGGFGAAGLGDIFEDIFEDFFGGMGGRRRPRPRRGRDIVFELQVSFTEAAFGVEKNLEMEREETCSTCRGEGAKPGTSRSACPECHGSGQVLASSGFFSISRTCHRCRGQGSFIAHPCSACHGTGRVLVKRKIHVKVPPGVDTGSRLRISGEGEAGDRGGERGDLYVDIEAAPHEFFKRDGDHLICEVPISFVQAALGCELEVPTLAGPEAVKIPPGAQTGKVFRLKGKGFPSLRGHGIGDEEIRITVETPAHLSERQKELLREFAAISGEKVNPVSSSFMEKVKDLFKK
ncbi:MAG: molecular chaperone DnaJ, partial [Candidatus Omnitrophica bacterium]|nr:molecular chaperone DnaJ [Candidatus Omnitrophota bacterium]